MAENKRAADEKTNPVARTVANIPNIPKDGVYKPKTVMTISITVAEIKDLVIPHKISPPTRSSNDTGVARIES